jgi:hypothetical protein
MGYGIEIWEVTFWWKCSSDERDKKRIQNLVVELLDKPLLEGPKMRFKYNIYENECLRMVSRGGIQYSCCWDRTCSLCHQSVSNKQHATFWPSNSASV